MLGRLADFERLVEATGKSPQLCDQRPDDRARRVGLSALERPLEHLGRPVATAPRLRGGLTVVAVAGSVEKAPPGRLVHGCGLLHERAQKYDRASAGSFERSSTSR